MSSKKKKKKTNDYPYSIVKEVLYFLLLLIMVLTVTVSIATITGPELDHFGLAVSMQGYNVIIACVTIFGVYDKYRRAKHYQMVYHLSMLLTYIIKLVLFINNSSGYNIIINALVGIIISVIAIAITFKKYNFKRK